MRHGSAALLLIAALLTGCGQITDSGASGAGAADSRPAPATTPGPELFAEVTDRMADEQTATFTFSGQGGGETLAGSGDMRFAGDSFGAEVQLTMPRTGRVRAVLLPTASYVALPAAKGLPRNKPWLKVSAQPRTRLGRQMRPVVDQLRGSFDPAQCLGLLKVARKVDEVGPATVEAVPTTRYHAEVDLRRATGHAEGPIREQYQSMLDAGVRTLEYDVWVDTSGLPRRFSTDIPTAEGLFSVTGVYRDWGKKVSIEQPAPKQVFDADKLAG
ncbi:MAG: hypothetical protein ACRDWY_03925 [Actinomycetes bacterium]